MKIAEVDPLERHMSFVRSLWVQSPGQPNDALYEQMKANLDRAFPGLHYADRDRALREIARACGV
ncbi:MAG: hypothetical protein NUV51_01870 [Sulfuricaulis sp.]|nr:hypothetical protein [Sulfuricaulis sp.]